jgi:uncharacterized protein YjiS (DUF1127 family)
MIRTEIHSLNSLHADTFITAIVKQVRAFGEFPVNMLKAAYLWQQRSDQRRQLSELSDNQLRDMGISREVARLEYTKPFWLP